MAVLRPIHFTKFEKFLKAVGCHYVRQSGDHRVWDRSDLMRPVIVRTKKDLPVMEIKSNLRTLGISTQEYLNIVEDL